MISCHKNVADFITAYIEWYILNKFGQFQENGEYLYIHDLWIHSSKRGTRVLNYLIHKIDTHPVAYNCKWVYWSREKYNRLTRLFPRERLAKLGLNSGLQGEKNVLQTNQSLYQESCAV